MSRLVILVLLSSLVVFAHARSKLKFDIMIRITSVHKLKLQYIILYLYLAALESKGNNMLPVVRLSNKIHYITLQCIIHLI